MLDTAPLIQWLTRFLRKLLRLSYELPIRIKTRVPLPILSMEAARKEINTCKRGLEAAAFRMPRLFYIVAAGHALAPRAYGHHEFADPADRALADQTQCILRFPGRNAYRCWLR